MLVIELFAAVFFTRFYRHIWTFMVHHGHFDDRLITRWQVWLMPPCHGMWHAASTVLDSQSEIRGGYPTLESRYLGTSATYTKAVLYEL